MGADKKDAVVKGEAKQPGKFWGKGAVKKIKFKRQPTKTELETKEIKQLKEQYEKFESSAVKSFRDMPLSKKTFFALKESGYTKPTEIQKESIGLALRGLDILGAAKTGSGKTLAFIVPVLELLNNKLWTKQDGLGALIITPTRELAYQIFEALKKVGKKHDFSAGLIIGGKDLKFERSRLELVNIMICTPGRLLQHMDENPNFTCDNLQILVLDEADRCLDMGFEATMNAIIANLPPDRQTLLFSATQTKSVKDLARLSLKSPVYVSVHENAQFSTPETLHQSYLVCPLESKMDMLWSFVKHHRKSKILVFLSSCKQVRFVHMLFCRMRPGMSLLALYGTLHQLKRMSVYEEFCRKQSVVLFATDIAARGLDFPTVDWVLQLDCPEDSTTYIHRAGRTARYNQKGESLLVLLPSEEEAMLEELNRKKIPIDKIEANPKKLVSVQRKFDSLLARDVTLKECAQRAFKAYLKSVFLMKNKKIFDVTHVDLPSFAASLGLAVAPRVRFLQKRLEGKFAQHPKNSLVKDPTSSEEEEEINVKNISKPTTYDFSVDGEEDDCDDLFVGKKAVTFKEDPEADAELLKLTNGGDSRSSKNKPKSKAAVAKKLLKKKIQSNKKVVFDEEGEAVADLRRERQSELAKDYEKEDASGIDIEKAKAIMKLEDQVDKKLHRDRIKNKHREERRKAKLARKGATDEPDEEEAQEIMLRESAENTFLDEEEDDDEPDLSWLPDPDKVYDQTHEDEADGDFSDKETESDSAGRLVRKRRHETLNDSDEDEYAGLVVNTSDSDSDEDESPAPPQPTKRKKTVESPKKKKKNTAEETTYDEEDENSLVGELNGHLMEELALKLLNSQK